MNWPENFGPKHPLWKSYPPSKRNLWLMEHGHVFPVPIMPTPNPIGDKKPLDFAIENPVQRQEPAIPENFGHYHPLWKIPSKRWAYINKLKAEDRRKCHPLRVRKLGQKTEECLKHEE